MTWSYVNLMSRSSFVLREWVRMFVDMLKSHREVSHCATSSKWLETFGTSAVDYNTIGLRCVNNNYSFHSRNATVTLAGRWRLAISMVTAAKILSLDRHSRRRVASKGVWSAYFTAVRTSRVCFMFISRFARNFIEQFGLRMSLGHRRSIRKQQQSCRITVRI